jgi:2-dehydro-3-deoxyphosphogluconate aldolase/(4S)-4-hydroxy-2-oxoglutarate aldolase
MMDAIIQLANFSRDFPAIQQIRIQVFQEEQGVDPALEFDGQDEMAEHFLAYVADRAVGTLRLRHLPANPASGSLRCSKIERLAVLPDFRGRGIGLQLMEAALDHLTQQGSQVAIVHAQTYIQGLYDKLGFLVEGTLFEEANIPHVKMTKSLNPLGSGSIVSVRAASPQENRPTGRAWAAPTAIDTWFQHLRQHPLIAVIRAKSMEQGWQIAQAAQRGGIRFLEIAWNSQDAASLIRKLRKELPNHSIGTGTILTPGQLEEAIEAGVQFCFSPGLDRTLIQQALAQQIPFIPGALSPTEILQAWQTGVPGVKVFPVQALGGVDYVRALQGPLGQIPLIPTGGVTLANAMQFLEAGAIAVGLSTALFPPDQVQAENWAAIEANAAQLVRSLKSLRSMG